MLSIIVPTYNERDNLPLLVGRLFDALGGSGIDAELIVVDDNSPDGTAAVAEALGTRYRVRVVRRPGKKGLSSAVMEGWRAAEGDILGVMDADLSHPPEVIPRVVAPIRRGQADVSVGSRYCPGGATDGWPAYRRLVSRGASLMAKPLTSLKDPMSGLIFFRRQVIQGVDLNPRGFKIGLEILVKGHYNVVVEVPYTFRDRNAGKSKCGPGEYVNYVRHASSLYRHAHPVLARATRAAGVTASFVTANVAALYLAVELGRLPVLPASALAFVAALGLLLGEIGESRALRGSPRLLLSLAALAGMAFALNMGAMFLVVVEMGEPYLRGDILADAFVVAPLLAAGIYSVPTPAPATEGEHIA